MIRRIHLQNFRRHTDTELVFGPDDHIIAITGVNGAGKSSILEALVFAFFGESRNGRRGLDSLVSRGAELEGVSVAVEFDVSNIQYRVERKRVDKVSSALLFAEGVLVAEGPTAVDAEVRNLFGMDSAGFKLAVIAKQKELDGLTSLSRRERQRMLARLLRVDVVARASQVAHERYQREKDILNAMGPEPDITAQEQAYAATLADCSSLEDALKSARQDVADLEQELKAAIPGEREFQKATARLDRAIGARDAALAELQRISTIASSKAPPQEVQIPVISSAQKFDELEKLLRSQTEARSLVEAHKAHKDLVELHNEVVDAITRISPRTSSPDLGPLAAAVASAGESLAFVVSQKDTTQGTFSQLKAELSVEKTALKNLEDLTDPVCPTCGQPVDEEHRQTEIEASRSKIAELEKRVSEVSAEFNDLVSKASELEVAHGEKLAELADAKAAEVSAQAARVELEELVRRRDSYELRLTRDLPEYPDLGGIGQKVDSCRRELQDIRDQETARAAYEKSLQEYQSIVSALQKAEGDYEQRELEVDSCQIAPHVTQAHEKVATITEDLAKKKEEGAELFAASKEAITKAEMAEVRLKEAKEFASRRDTHATAARISAYTKSTLKTVHQMLSAELRPNLEGALCQILTQLSDGRFSAAKLDENYEVTVLDDGKYRPIAELSGGESDLVALAVRLALSSVVAERSGTDALGLLILDEVFGSQDKLRQEAILTALRELRSSYGQVFLISHVGGVEQAADKVVDLKTDKSRQLTEVSVL